MPNPIIADIRPAKVQLIKGQEYHFCTCGLSKSQPFCDGSHVGTSFQPKVIVTEKDKTAMLCTCKATKKSPYCDGTHRFFTKEQIGTELITEEKAQVTQDIVKSTIDEPTLEFIHQLSQDRLMNWMKKYKPLKDV